MQGGCDGYRDGCCKRSGICSCDGSCYSSCEGICQKEYELVPAMALAWVSETERCWNLRVLMVLVVVLQTLVMDPCNGSCAIVGLVSFGASGVGN